MDRDKKNDDFVINLTGIIKDGETYSTVILSDTVPINEINNKSIRDMLDYMYQSKDPAFNRMGSILNAVLTQKQCTFLLSARIASKLFIEDVNSKYNSVNSQTYRAIIAKMITATAMFKKLRSPVGSRAAVFKLVHTDLMEYMYIAKGKEYYDTQEQVVLEIYDNGDDNGEEVVTKPKMSFAEYIDREGMGEQLIESASEALAHAKGEIELKETLVGSALEIEDIDLSKCKVVTFNEGNLKLPVKEEKKSGRGKKIF